MRATRKHVVGSSTYLQNFHYWYITNAETEGVRKGSWACNKNSTLTDATTFIYYASQQSGFFLVLPTSISELEI